MSDAPQPSPIEYFSPDSTSAAAAGQQHFSVAALMAGCIACALLSILFGLIVPRFEMVFKDFGTKLPFITILVLDVSRQFRTWGWIPVWLVPFVIGFISPLMLPFKRAPWRGGVKWVFGILLVLTIGIGIFVAIAMFMPMVTISTGISSPK